MSIIITAQSNPAAQTSSSPATFTSVSLGAAFAGRVIVVGVSSDSLSNPTDTVTCTIAGNSAASCIQQTDSSGRFQGLFSIVDASNATADIVLTDVGGSSFNDVDISVYVITGANSATPNSTAAYQFAFSVGDPLLTTSALTVPSGGGYIVQGMYFPASGSATWNTPIAGDYATAIGGYKMQSAHNASSSGSITPSVNASTNGWGMVAASWASIATANLQSQICM